jgi:hypothetical protein
VSPDANSLASANWKWASVFEQCGAKAIMERKESSMKSNMPKSVVVVDAFRETSSYHPS